MPAHPSNPKIVAAGPEGSRLTPLAVVPLAPMDCCSPPPTRTSAQPATGHLVVFAALSVEACFPPTRSTPADPKYC
jgi:hypothetical protein